MVMFKRMAWAVSGLLGLLLVVMLVSRYWPASAMQKQARAALEGPVAWPGNNGWALMETLNHEDLDMAQRQALVDERAARFAQWVQATAPQRYGEPEPGAVQHGQLPELALPGQRWMADEVLCRGGNRDCLAQVRRDPQAVAAALQARRGVIERVAALADYGHVRSPYLADVDMPYPAPISRLFDPLAAHALAHAQGDSTLAMTGLCRDIGTARMLLGHSDNVVVAMTGQSMLQANTLLLAQVLAELPPRAQVSSLPRGGVEGGRARGGDSPWSLIGLGDARRLRCGRCGPAVCARSCPAACVARRSTTDCGVPMRWRARCSTRSRGRCVRT